MLPGLEAQLALSRRDDAKAIEALQAAAPYELGVSAGLYAVYLRGEAFLAAHEGSKAVGEFQKIIDHRVAVLNPVGALAKLGLARAYGLQGGRVKSKEAYPYFLALWREAESGVPVLKISTTEDATLQ